LEELFTDESGGHGEERVRFSRCWKLWRRCVAGLGVMTARSDFYGRRIAGDRVAAGDEREARVRTLTTVARLWRRGAAGVHSIHRGNRGRDCRLCRLRPRRAPRERSGAEERRLCAGRAQASQSAGHYCFPLRELREPGRKKNETRPAAGELTQGRRLRRAGAEWGGDAGTPAEAALQESGPEAQGLRCALPGLVSVKTENTSDRCGAARPWSARGRARTERE